MEGKKINKKFFSISAAAISLYMQFQSDAETDMEEFWTAAGLLFGKDLLMTWADEGGYDRIQEALLKNLSIFRDADTTGNGFIKRLYQLLATGQLTDSSGKNLLEISKNQDGERDFGITPDNLKVIAQKMEISDTVLQVCLLSLAKNRMRKDNAVV